jgi:hypothetical protein
MHHHTQDPCFWLGRVDNKPPFLTWTNQVLRGITVPWGVRTWPQIFLLLAMCFNLPCTSVPRLKKGQGKEVGCGSCHWPRDTTYWISRTMKSHNSWLQHGKGTIEDINGSEISESNTHEPYQVNTQSLRSCLSLFRVAGPLGFVGTKQ